MGQTPKMFAVVGVLLLALGGCGPRDSRQAVSGTVTFRGVPLEQGAIRFFPSGEAAPPSSGTVIQDGAFTVPKDHGLEPGTYRVIISSPVVMPGSARPNGSPETREQIPARYNTASELTAEVTSKGPNRFEFKLEP